MINLVMKFMVFIAKIVVFGSVMLVFPLVILYATQLNAKSLQKADIITQEKPDLVTIPIPVKGISRGTIISEADLELKDVSESLVNDMIAQDMLQLVGQEARRTLYKSKPILLRDIGAVTIIRRNDSVTLRFEKGAMVLQTTGRALENGGAGDVIKVMNEQSKKIVTGRVSKNGEIDVSI